MNYFIHCIRNKYSSFSGRARRKEFWYFMLFSTIFSIVPEILDDNFGPLSTIYWLALFLPSLAVTARRLHDIDVSGWYQLWYLLFLLVAGAGAVVVAVVAVVAVGAAVAFVAGVPIISGLVTVAVCGLVTVAVGGIALFYLCKKGTSGDNRFGTDPLAES